MPADRRRDGGVVFSIRQLSSRKGIAVLVWVLATCLRSSHTPSLIHAFSHPNNHSCKQTLMHPLFHSLTHSLVQTSTNSNSHSLPPSYTYSYSHVLGGDGTLYLERYLTVLMERSGRRAMVSTMWTFLILPGLLVGFDWVSQMMMERSGRLWAQLAGVAPVTASRFKSRSLRQHIATSPSPR